MPRLYPTSDRRFVWFNAPNRPYLPLHLLLLLLQLWGVGSNRNEGKKGKEKVIYRRAQPLITITITAAHSIYLLSLLESLFSLSRCNTWPTLVIPPSTRVSPQHPLTRTQLKLLLVAYQDVRSDKSDTNWLLLDYEVCLPRPPPRLDSIPAGRISADWMETDHGIYCNRATARTS